MKELEGIIENGNFAFSGHPTRPNSPSEISLTGDTALINCNLTLASIQTNGYVLTRTNCNEHGLRINDVKVDSYICQAKGIHPTIQSIMDGLSGMELVAADAFRVFYEVVRAGSPTMSISEMRTDFNAAAGDSPIDADKFKDTLLSLSGLGTWAQLRDFLQSASLEMLQGANTEVVSEYS